MYMYVYFFNKHKNDDYRTTDSSLLSLIQSSLSLSLLFSSLLIQSSLLFSFNLLFSSLSSLFHDAT